jgi:hypothetical protein
VEATVLSDNPDNQPAEMADQAIVAVAKAGPEPVAAPTLDRYDRTPILWRALEEIAAALPLFLLRILVMKQLMSRRIDG